MWKELFESELVDQFLSRASKALDATWGIVTIHCVCIVIGYFVFGVQVRTVLNVVDYPSLLIGAFVAVRFMERVEAGDPSWTMRAWARAGQYLARVLTGVRHRIGW